MASAMENEEAFKGYLQTLVKDISKKRPVNSADAITQYFHHFQKMVTALHTLTVDAMTYHAMKDELITLMKDIDEFWKMLGCPPASNRGRKQNYGSSP